MQSAIVTTSQSIFMAFDVYFFVMPFCVGEGNIKTAFDKDLKMEKRHQVLLSFKVYDGETSLTLSTLRFFTAMPIYPISTAVSL